MKHTKLFAVIVFLSGTLLFVALSCDKEDENPTTGRMNLVEFEDLSLHTHVSPNFYDNHIYRIELLGDNLERAELLREVQQQGIDPGCLNMAGSRKFFMNHSDILMYSIPTRDPERTVIVYAYEDLYQVNMAEYRYISENRRKFELKTLDDRLFYSLQLDEQDRIGKFSMEENYMMDAFNTEIYALNLDKPHLKSTRDHSAECCRKEATWKACMNCTVKDCSESWLCVASLVLLGPETLAAFSVSCVGAGPNTWC
jgi:hypothetical protein